MASTAHVQTDNKKHYAREEARKEKRRRARQKILEDILAKPREFFEGERRKFDAQFYKRKGKGIRFMGEDGDLLPRYRNVSALDQEIQGEQGNDFKGIYRKELRAYQRKFLWRRGDHAGEYNRGSPTRIKRHIQRATPNAVNFLRVWKKKYLSLAPAQRDQFSAISERLMDNSRTMYGEEVSPYGAAVYNAAFREFFSYVTGYSRHLEASLTESIERQTEKFCEQFPVVRGLKSREALYISTIDTIVERLIDISRGKPFSDKAESDGSASSADSSSLIEGIELAAWIEAISRSFLTGYGVNSNAGFPFLLSELERRDPEAYAFWKKARYGAQLNQMSEHYHREETFSWRNWFASVLSTSAVYALLGASFIFTSYTRQYYDHHAAAINTMICDRQPTMIDLEMYLNSRWSPETPSIENSWEEEITEAHTLDVIKEREYEYVIFSREGLGIQNISVIDRDNNGAYVSVREGGKDVLTYSANASGIEIIPLMTPWPLTDVFTARGRFIHSVAHGSCDDFVVQGEQSLVIESSREEGTFNSQRSIRRIPIKGPYLMRAETETNGDITYSISSQLGERKIILKQEGMVLHENEHRNGWNNPFWWSYGTGISRRESGGYLR